MVGVGRIAIICLTAVAMVACLAPQNVEMAGVDMQSWSDVKSRTCFNATINNLFAI